MNLYRFLQLNEIEQANAVWDEGKFLAHRNDEVNDYALYELCDFFIQVTYSGFENTILTIKPFNTIKLLEPYWQNVSLSDLRGLH